MIIDVKNLTRNALNIWKKEVYILKVKCALIDDIHINPIYDTRLTPMTHTIRGENG